MEDLRRKYEDMVKKMEIMEKKLIWKNNIDDESRNMTSH